MSPVPAVIGVLAVIQVVVVLLVAEPAPVLVVVRVHALAPVPAVLARVEGWVHYLTGTMVWSKAWEEARPRTVVRREPDQDQSAETTELDNMSYELCLIFFPKHIPEAGIPVGIIPAIVWGADEKGNDWG